MIFEKDVHANNLSRLSKSFTVLFCGLQLVLFHTRSVEALSHAFFLFWMASLLGFLAVNEVQKHLGVKNGNKRSGELYGWLVVATFIYMLGVNTYLGLFTDQGELELPEFMVEAAVGVVFAWVVSLISSSALHARQLSRFNLETSEPGTMTFRQEDLASIFSSGMILRVSFEEDGVRVRVKKG